MIGVRKALGQVCYPLHEMIMTSTNQVFYVGTWGFTIVPEETVAKVPSDIP